MTCCSMSSLFIGSSLYFLFQISIHLSVTAIGESVLTGLMDVDSDYLKKYLPYLYDGHLSKYRNHFPYDFIEFSIASRTQVLAVLYLTFDCLSFVSTFFLLIFSTKRPKWFNVTVLVVWDVIAFLEILLDLSTSFMHAMEIGESNFPPERPSPYAHFGSIFLFMYSSRLIVFLITNIVFFALIMVATIRYMYDQPMKGNKRTVPLKKPDKGVLKNNRPSNLSMENCPRVDMWYKNYDNNNGGMPMPQYNDNDGQPSVPQYNDSNYRVPQYNDNDNIQNSRPQYNDYNNSRMRVPQYDDGNNIQHSVPQYSDSNKSQMRVPQSNHNNNSYPPAQSEYPPVSNSFYQPEQLRQRESSNGFVGGHTNVLINGVESGTLRRQLPWSYVRDPDAVLRKQRRAGDGPEAADMPPVPVPDYTLRLPRNHHIDTSRPPQPPPKFRNRY